LCVGKQKWTDARVAKVFQKWSELTPYYSPAFAGLTWQEAAQQLLHKKAGMYLLGLFVSEQFVASGNPDDLNQLDFFPFPDVGSAKRITQFFDRDSRPDFSGPNSMQGFLLRYLSNPKQDTTSLQGQMQSFWDSLPPE